MVPSVAVVPPTEVSTARSVPQSSESSSVTEKMRDKRVNVLGVRPVVRPVKGFPVRRGNAAPRIEIVHSVC